MVDRGNVLRIIDSKIVEGSTIVLVQREAARLVEVGGGDGVFEDVESSMRSSLESSLEPSLEPSVGSCSPGHVRWESEAARAEGRGSRVEEVPGNLRRAGQGLGRFLANEASRRRHTPDFVGSDKGFRLGVLGRLQFHR